jgi:hypothetical protein
VAGKRSQKIIGAFAKPEQSQFAHS